MNEEYIPKNEDTSEAEQITTDKQMEMTKKQSANREPMVENNNIFSGIKKEDNIQLENVRQELDEEVIKNLISGNIGNQEFKQRISLAYNESLNENTFLRALEVIKSIDSGLSESERVKLFKDTLEYYISDIKAEKPVWHSTNSYVLRKALEDGFSGGHGRYSGEASHTVKEGKSQGGLSVTHPEYASAESFQQLFARLGCKREDIGKYLGIDSEKISGKSMPYVFVEELLATTSEEDMKEMVVKRLNCKPEEVTPEIISHFTSDESKLKFIEDFNKRQYIPNMEYIRRDILPGIQDVELRNELEYEAENSFPCLITFETKGKEGNLTTVSRGERPTHIPFEDFYWDKFNGNDIKEIRVPKNQIKKVSGWLEEKGLRGINIVPIEVYEVRRIIEDQAE
jgi:hypothetical protein